MRNIFGAKLCLLLNVSILKLIFKLDSKSEGRSSKPFRFESNGTIKSLHNFLGYDKTESNSSRVDIFGALNESKQFEEFLLIFSLDSHSRVRDLDLTVGFLILLV
jgi:hypothetical protein